MNSFEFKPPKDRQTDIGDSGEAPQPFPKQFFYYEQFFLFIDNMFFDYEQS